MRTTSACGSLPPRLTILEPPRDAERSGRAGGGHRPRRGAVTRGVPAVEEGRPQLHRDGEHTSRVGGRRNRPQVLAGGGQRQSRAVATRSVYHLSTLPLLDTVGLAAHWMEASLTPPPLICHRSGRAAPPVHRCPPHAPAQTGILSVAMLTRGQRRSQ